jgi:hypothetical protein
MKFGKKLKTRAIAGSFAVAATIFFCLLFLPPAASAKTLDAYRTSVRSAAVNTQKLLDSQKVVEAAGLQNGDFERNTLAVIRQTLPATEKVEWDGNLIETGNQWLEAKLKNFEESRDAAQRRAILTEIGERLRAIEEKIIELENAAASARTKDEDKRKLAEILRRAEYQKPAEEQESWFARLQKRIKSWFDRKFPQPDIPQSTQTGFQTVSFGLQLLLYAVVLGFIGFLIYRFAPFFAGHFRRRTRDDRGERVILGEKLAADEDARTLFDEAEALASAGNLRAAIRKGYIAMLCEMSDRKVIGLAQHKTNRDYLRDVRKQQALYENMHGLTDSFERHWYGFERADEGDWNEFKRIYQRTVSDVN